MELFVVHSVYGGFVEKVSIDMEIAAEFDDGKHTIALMEVCEREYQFSKESNGGQAQIFVLLQTFDDDISNTPVGVAFCESNADRWVKSSSCINKKWQVCPVQEN